MWDLNYKHLHILFTLQVTLFHVVWAVTEIFIMSSLGCNGDFFNVQPIKTDIMNLSKRQTTPWTKSRRRPRLKKKEKGEHFIESKKKELTSSDKGSWFDQPSSDVSEVSQVSHPSTSRELGARSLKLMPLV